VQSPALGAYEKSESTKTHATRYLTRMNKLSCIGLVVALGACGKSSSSSAPPADESKPTVAPVASEPKAPPANPMAALVALINSARSTAADKVDLTTFGSSIEAYVVTRSGARSDEDDTAQLNDLSLVLVSEGRATRIELDRFAEYADSMPFGQITAAVPRTSGAVTEDETFFGAPRFKGTAPLLIGKVHSFYGDERAYLVSRDKAGLVVWTAESVHEQGTSKKWERAATITLAAGATVSAPKADLATPPIALAATLRVTEGSHKAAAGNGYLTFNLRIGDLAGPMGDCFVAEPAAGGEVAWTMTTSTPAELALPGAPAPVAQVLAHRTCRTKDLTRTLVLGRKGDLVSVHMRDDKDTPGEWESLLEVTVPAAVKTAAR
jgi:hypothetical protein